MIMKMDRMASLVFGLVVVALVVWLMLQAKAMMSESFDRLDEGGLLWAAER